MKPTIELARAEFFDKALRGREPGTLANWLGTFNRLYERIPRETCISSLGWIQYRVMMRDMVSTDKNPDKSYRTLRKYYEHLSAFFEFCRRQHYIIDSPFDIDQVPPPRGRTIQKQVHPTEQMDDIEAELSEPWKSIFILYRYLGLRGGELLQNGRPSYRPLRFDGKKWVNVYNAKEHRDDMMVVDDAEVLELLRNNSTIGGEVIFQGCTYKDFWTVLKLANKSVLWRNDHALRPKLYLDHISVQDLRRWYGEKIAHETGNPIQTANAMRHRDMKTTFTNYAHIFNEQDMRAALGTLRNRGA